MGPQRAHAGIDKGDASDLRSGRQMRDIRLANARMKGWKSLNSIAG